MTGRSRIAKLIIWSLLIVSIVLGLICGAYHMSWQELWQAASGQSRNMDHFLVWQVRMPRLCLALIVGAGLATTGAATQGLFRNPLAEPTLVGVTSGAMLAAVTMLVLGGFLPDSVPLWLRHVGLNLAAFGGALLSTVIVYRLATDRGRVNIATMLLAGIAIAALCGALTGMLIFISDEKQLRDITFWTLGSLGGASWSQVAVAAPLVVLGTWVLHRNALALNAFFLGEAEALHLGFRIKRVKTQVVLCVAVVVGCCIAFTGLIGFVGLIIPHLLRLWLGADHRRLLVNSALLGGSFLLLADTMARTVVAPAELPIGILTSLVGAPFFLWLLLRERRKMAWR